MVNQQMDNQLDFVKWRKPSKFATVIGWLIGIAAMLLGIGIAAMTNLLEIFK